jgi:fructokinase
MATAAAQPAGNGAEPARRDQALPRLVVFGEALTDLVRCGDDRWRSIPGGACWNVARVASMQGVATGWAGSVGQDLFGDELLQRSAGAGLDLRFAQQVAQPPLLALVHQLDPPRYFFMGSADQGFDETLLPEGWQDGCDYAHFGCISLVRQPLGARLVAMAEALHARGVRISFDPNWRNLMDADYPALVERLAGIADLVKLSDEDLARIYPRRPQEQALDALRTRMAPGAKLLFTRGARGMRLYLDGQVFEQDALRVPVRDTVGAGDACVGGLLASLLQRPEAEWPSHLRWAAACAAATCMHDGAHAPEPAEVKGLLADASLAG